MDRLTRNDGNWLNGWLYGTYLQIMFYLNFIFSRFPFHNPFARFIQHERRFESKSLLSQLMENIAGEDAKLINPDETVEETFANKIANRDYESAIKLAKKFDLNMDMVYKSKWLNSPVDIELIDECLAKISTPFWSLQQCIQHVPADLEIAEYLLKFGLNLLSNELAKNEMAPTTKDCENIEQFKQKIHLYFERMVVYKEILKKKHDSLYEEHFDPQSYERFRNKSIFESAIECASEADEQQLLILFRYKSHLLHKHLLVILANFCETVAPTKYSEIIKLIDKQPEQSESLANIDVFDHTLDVDAFVGDRFEHNFYKEKPHFLQFILPPDEDTTQIKIDFFHQRALEMLEETLLVDNSLQLLEYAILMGFDLQELYIELDLYSILVYDSLQNCVSFAQFEKMSLIEKIKASLVENEIPFLIEKIIENFLEKIGKLSSYKGVPTNKTQVLKELMVELARDNFSQCLKIFEICTMVDKAPEDVEKIKLINDPCVLIELAVDCLKQYDNSDELATAFRIMECLPDRSQADLLIGDDPVKARLFNRVNDEADRIEYFLSLIEVLRDYNIKLTIKDLLAIVNETDVSKVRQNIDSMIRMFCTVSFGKTDLLTEFKNFLWNLEDLRQNYLSSTITTQDLLAICIRSLLFSGNTKFINLAIDHINFRLDVKSKKKLDFQIGKRLLLEAATDYIDFCDLSQSVNIKLAKLCLEALRSVCAEDEMIMEYVDFVEALDIIFEQFILDMLPAQMLTIKQPRLQILDTILASSSSSYLKIDKIMVIAKLLRIGKDFDKTWREGAVLLAIGKSALRQRDFEFASNICKIILEKNLKTSWEVCYLLASSHPCPIAPAERLVLLSFALTFSPQDNADVLYEILNLIKSIKASHNFNKNEHININFKGDISILE